MRRALICLALVTWASVSMAATNYYFSDCGYDHTTSPAELADRPSACGASQGIDDAPSGCLCSDWIQVEGLWMRACQTGAHEDDVVGRGSFSNPWCLAPESPSGDITRNSFESMMDGGAGLTLTTELVSGDTVYLCAGDCDGEDQAYWPLQGHTCYTNANGCSGTNTCVFDTEAAGPITIKPYCDDDGNCERVIMTGDSNMDNAYTTGEPANFWGGNDCDAGTVRGNDSYTLDGDPNDDGEPDWVVEKFRNYAFYMTHGANGWTWDGLEIRYLNDPMYQCTGEDCDNLVKDGIGRNGVSPACVPLDHNGTAFTLNWELGTVTFNGLEIHHLCTAGYRLNNNCLNSAGTPTQGSGCTSGPTLITISNNEAWNIYTFANYHQSKNVVIDGNYLHDVLYGIDSEEQTKSITVTDNVVACLGQYDISDNSSLASSRTCKTGISFKNGDSNPHFGGNDGCADDCGYFCTGSGSPSACCTGFHTGPSCTASSSGTCHGNGASSTPCFSTDNLVARNVVYGVAASSAQPGYMQSGIWYENHNTDGADSTVIENNTIYRIQKSNGCDMDNVDNRQETAMAIRGPDSIIVRNNTILDSACPVYLDNAAHTFTNNIVMRGHHQGGSGDQYELFVFDSAAASTITNNLFSPVDGSVAPVCIAPAEAFPATCATTHTCANPMTTLGGGTTNVCVTMPSPMFHRCGFDGLCYSVVTAANEWDLFSISLGAAYVDMGTDGATTDRQGEVRPNPGTGITDAGSDEYYLPQERVPPSSIPDAPGGGSF